MRLQSIPRVCDVETIGNAESDPSVPADLLIEIPHGATEASDYTACREQLQGAYPDDLREFFFVNTDVGAPEVGRKIAERLAASGSKTLIVRSRIPRTFIDCNREVAFRRDADSAAPLTPGLPEYVTTEADRALLADLHRTYHQTVSAAYEQVCGSGGLALCLHTYAPKSVQIYDVDAGIVKALRVAYLPQNYVRWADRPAVDVISETEEGRLLAPAELVREVRRSYAGAGVEVRENETYRLHPGSMGHVYSTRHSGRVLCLEISRALLVKSFTPFQPMSVDPTAVARMSDPIVRALAVCLPRR